MPIAYETGETLMGSKEVSLTAFLHIALYKLLRVRLEHGVDLVEEVVELFLQLLALLGRRGDVDFFCDPLLGRRSLFPLTLWHRATSSRSLLQPGDQLRG